MNYKKHYEFLCERAKTKKLKEYTEKHHVLPKCLGGEDSKENLVDLTPEEHYVAHQLLVKMYPDHKGLIWAALQMTGQPNGKRNTNKVYGWLKRRWSKQCKRRKGKSNGSYGRHWYYNPETLDNVKCLPEEVPEGYIKGRKLKKNNECLVCGKDTGGTLATFCSVDCRYSDNQKRAYALLEEYMDSDFKSINSFSKYKNMNQQNLSLLWKNNITGYNELTSNKMRSKSCYQSLLGEKESRRSYKA